MGIDLGPMLYMILAMEAVLGILCLAGGYLLVRKALDWTKAGKESPAEEEGGGLEGKGRLPHSWALVKR